MRLDDDNLSGFVKARLLMIAGFLQQVFGLHAAFAALRRHAQLFGQLLHRSAASGNGVADLSIGHGFAQTNVHGE